MTTAKGTQSTDVYTCTCTPSLAHARASHEAEFLSFSSSEGWVSPPTGLRFGGPMCTRTHVHRHVRDKLPRMEGSMPNALPAPSTITALTTAAPGWTITIGSPRSGDQVTVPVVAWAAVTPGEGPADIYMRVEAVFVVDGSVWSTSDYHEVFDYSTEIHPPAEGAR